MSDSEQLVIYQLHIFILGISPMIWRSVKIRCDSTIADLYYIIQIAMALMLMMFRHGLRVGEAVGAKDVTHA
jgi:hypothetical protein